ncbi:Phage protein [Alloactinosynnema sp. L-07]|uniref:hypothetical protein n=1 Tax=Alloactinosynnema sp. L-07 TaxID=1653480 RepID=UPI00065EFCBD|nr:hypothetical protein [Alloactinosynnema sp. L-07]CRK59066.1 Phage protein [Alloactinosynnema sp. L-07]
MGAREQDALIRQFVTGRRTLRSALVEYIRRWFLTSESFRDADATRFVNQVVPVALGAQRSIASAAWAFQGRMLADLTGDRAAPVPLRVDQVTGAALRGVDPDVVYRRPFNEIYRQLGDGKSLTEAVTAGERRAKLIGLTDLELADTHAAREILATDRRRAPRFFRRELTGDENCGLCVIASTQRYRTGELMPIHPGCDCVPVPIAATKDPGQVIDRALLDAAHVAIEQRFGKSDVSGRAPDYRKILLVREHGELGPVLTVAKHRFTGAEDVPAAAR